MYPNNLINESGYTNFLPSLFLFISDNSESQLSITSKSSNISPPYQRFIVILPISHIVGLQDVTKCVSSNELCNTAGIIDINAERDLRGSL